MLCNVDQFTPQSFNDFQMNAISVIAFDYMLHDQQSSSKIFIDNCCELCNHDNPNQNESQIVTQQHRLVPN